MNKIILLFLFIASFSHAKYAQAENLGTISGKLVSITEKDFALQKQKTTYFIKKSALSPEETNLLKQIGKRITVHVPLEAIDAVKHDK